MFIHIKASPRVPHSPFARGSRMSCPAGRAHSHLLLLLGQPAVSSRPGKKRCFPVASPRVSVCFTAPSHTPSLPAVLGETWGAGEAAVPTPCALVL